MAMSAGGGCVLTLAQALSSHCPSAGGFGTPGPGQGGPSGLSQLGPQPWSRLLGPGRGSRWKPWAL